MDNHPLPPQPPKPPKCVKGYEMEDWPTDPSYDSEEQAWKDAFMKGVECGCCLNQGSKPKPKPVALLPASVTGVLPRPLGKAAMQAPTHTREWIDDCNVVLLSKSCPSRCKPYPAVCT